MLYILIQNGRKEATSCLLQHKTTLYRIPLHIPVQQNFYLKFLRTHGQPKANLEMQFAYDIRMHCIPSDNKIHFIMNCVVLF